MRYRRHRPESLLPAPTPGAPLSVFDPRWSELLDPPPPRRHHAEPREEPAPPDHDPIPAVLT